MAVCCGVVAALLAWASTPATAHAAFGLSAFDGAVLDEQGEGFTQAGGHPATASVTFALNRRTVNGWVFPDGGELANATVDLPPGFLGNPKAVAACPKDRTMPTDTEAKVATTLEDFCPLSSIVGRAVVTMNLVGSVTRLSAPVYNLEPPPGMAAQFGFSFLNQRTYLDARVRNGGDYGVTIRARNLNQSVPVFNSAITLWGVPAHSRHDGERCFAFEPVTGESGSVPGCDPASPFPLLRPGRSDDPPRAFISNPTRCTPPGVGLETRISVSSWTPGLPIDQASFMSHLPPGYPLSPLEWGPEAGPTGCEHLPFQPALDIRPDTTRPDAPTGPQVDLTMPQDSLVNPTGLSPAHLKRVSVTFPEGMTVNPSSASGLQACSDSEFGLGQAGPASCPAASKIGTVTGETPVLDEVLEGTVYVGSQRSDDPESGDLFRVFMTLDNPERDIAVKLRGNVRANAQTGRLEAVFDNNPQVPVSRVSLRLKGGDRAPLATPPRCGAIPVSSSMTSWGGQVAAPSASFELSCPFAHAFDPEFEAGSARTTAGSFSPFAARLIRKDGDQYLKGVAVRLPGGILAKLRGVPLCESRSADVGTCPKASRVGTVTVGVGAGAHPYHVKGAVFLTESYRGGPYGLAVVVRAVAGPFDLGTVVVRQAIYVDPTDAHLTVISDPLPIVVKGVPLRLRTVNLETDRPRFTINPTSCAEKQIRAVLSSDSGTAAVDSQRFQVGGCRSLDFKPKLSMRLTGRNQVRAGKHPALKSVLSLPGGQANVRRVQVTLPLSLALDPENADGLCEFDEGQKTDPRCPKSSIVGSAVARTPVLNRPLKGPVYFVKGVRISETGRRIRTLPTLLIALRGEVSLNVRARTSVSKDRLVTTFPVVPDAPVSRFELSLKGGKQGILTVSSGNLCSRRQVASTVLDAQNGRQARPGPTIATPCSRGGKR